MAVVSKVTTAASCAIIQAKEILPHSRFLLLLLTPGYVPRNQHCFSVCKSKVGSFHSRELKCFLSLFSVRVCIANSILEAIVSLIKLSLKDGNTTTVSYTVHALMKISLNSLLVLLRFLRKSFRKDVVFSKLIESAGSLS